MVDKIIHICIRHVAGVRCQLHLAGKQPGLGAQLSGFFHQAAGCSRMGAVFIQYGGETYVVALFA